jgi:hypothetical protein
VCLCVVLRAGRRVPGAVLPPALSGDKSGT